MLKVAIIGCGKIADAHAAQIQRIPGCRLTAVCDREPLMAEQLSIRFGCPKPFSDVEEMLEVSRPDVVHITTPPQSHSELSQSCLRKGCHVYVEKPFAVNATEAEAVVQLAREKNLKVTVGHDDQFRHVARRMRKLVAAGYLGGPPIHMESHYCYDFGDSDGYAKALLGDKQHWVRRLPGGLLQNIISHGIARIAEFLTTDSPTVVAHGFVSPLLRGMSEKGIVDELRVIVDEAGETTAYFTFSAQMRPAVHQFRIFGRQNGLFLDQDNETLIKLPGRRHKSYLEQFVPPINFAGQYLGNLMCNARLFQRCDFHPKAGMKFLIESFYKAVTADTPPPIPYDEILRTTRIMDLVFAQIGNCPATSQAGQWPTAN